MSNTTTTKLAGGVKRPSRRLLRRARSRGMVTVGNVLECAMVMGWFVILILGEMAVSTANDSRREAETTSEQSATASAASHCQPKIENVGQAMGTPSVLPGGTPNASAVISAIAGLGIGGERTFINYIKPLQNIETKATARTRTHEFEGQRELGCLEKPIDLPRGSMDQYRIKIWVTNLMGY